MGRLGFCLSVGTLLMLLGWIPLLVAFTFADMVGPDIEGWDWWATVLPRVFNFSNHDWCFSVPPALILLGGALLVLYGIFATALDAVRGVGETK
jgi:hypothetical protein